MKRFGFPYAKTESLVSQQPMPGYKQWQVDAEQQRLSIERGFLPELRLIALIMLFVWGGLVIVALGIHFLERLLSTEQILWLLILWTVVCLLLAALMAFLSLWWFRRTSHFEFNFQSEQLRIGKELFPFKEIKAVRLHTLLLVERFRSTYDFHNPVDGAELGHQLRIQTYSGSLIQHTTPFAFFSQQADAQWLAMALAQAMRVRYQFNDDPPKRVH